MRLLLIVISLGVLSLAPSEPLYSVNEEHVHFYQLPITAKEQKVVYKIIKSLGEKNLAQLLIKKGELEGLGKKIEHIHPLRFAGYIFSEPHLRYCMNNIEKSYFKWNKFISEFSHNMSIEARHGNLIQHVPGFANQLGYDQNQIYPFIYQRNWEGLMRFLL